MKTIEVILVMLLLALSCAVMVDMWPDFGFCAWIISFYTERSIYAYTALRGGRDLPHFKDSRFKVDCYRAERSPQLVFFIHVVMRASLLFIYKTGRKSFSTSESWRRQCGDERNWQT